MSFSWEEAKARNVIIDFAEQSPLGILYWEHSFGISVNLI